MDINEAVKRAKELLDDVIDPNRGRASYDLHYELGLCMEAVDAYLNDADKKEFG